MPRTVDFSIESSASVEQIRSAFSAEDYWLARLAAFGGLGRLDSLTIDTDGSASVVIIHELRHDGLPGLVANFFPRDWQVVQNETWSFRADPSRENTALAARFLSSAGQIIEPAFES